MRASKLSTMCQPLLLVVVLVLLGASGTQENGPKIPDISQRINSFTMDLLKHQADAKDHPANTILSPQSIFHGLAMSYIASGGDTRKELCKVFHFPEKNEDLLNDLANLRKQLHKVDKHKRIDVTIANSVWLDETYADFRKEYVKEVQKAFEASLNRVKFMQKERASDAINKWVSEKTRGKIQKSVDPSDFKSRSQPGIIDEPALVTVNAVYFKADWGSRFDKSSTRKRIFNTDKTSTVETPMMHQRSSLLYSENEKLKFLELPYIDNLCTMYLILPKDTIGVPDLIKTLTIDQIVELRQRAFGCEVDVFLPKFEMRSHLGTKDALSAMGVKAAFSKPDADFDKMINKKPEAFRIYISEIYHDAWVDVHEEGTEAAAATSTVHFSFGCSAPAWPMQVEFHADHPFLFMIIHNESRSILFAGWISNPKEFAQQPAT
jgi:serpin B